MAEKKDKRKYMQSKRGYGPTIEPGMRGVLLSVGEMGKEAPAVRDAYAAFNQFLENTKAQSGDAADADAEPDQPLCIEDELEQEVAALKEQRVKKDEREFNSIPTGSKGLMFVRTSTVDPVKLVRSIFEDITVKKEQISRYLQKMIPVTCICKATPEAILKAMPALLERYFLNEHAPPRTFAIWFKARNCQMKKDEVQDAICTMAKAGGRHRVHLGNPELVISLEILTRVCCLSVLSDASRFHNYNIFQHAMDQKPRPAATSEQLDSSADELDEIAEVAVSAGDQADAGVVVVAAAAADSAEPDAKRVCVVAVADADEQ